MFQRLPKIPAQVQAGNTSQNLPNKICQIIYFLYRAKEIAKKVYNNIMNSTNLLNLMDPIFMNSKESDSQYSQ